MSFSNTVRLIKSLSTSYEHMKPILMYGKDTGFTQKSPVNFCLKKEGLAVRNVSTTERALVVKEGKKKDSGKRVY